MEKYTFEKGRGHQQDIAIFGQKRMLNRHDIFLNDIIINEHGKFSDEIKGSLNNMIFFFAFFVFTATVIIVIIILKI